MGKIEEYLESIVRFFSGIGKIINIIIHPILIWNWLVGISYWVAVIICSLCIIYYAVTKSNRFSKAMWITIVTYILLKGVDMVI